MSRDVEGEGREATVSRLTRCKKKVHKCYMTELKKKKEKKTLTLTYTHKHSRALPHTQTHSPVQLAERQQGELQHATHRPLQQKEGWTVPTK